MASAVRIAPVVKTEEKVETPATYTITLTEREAEMLKAITGNVVGVGELRIFVDAIYAKLNAAGTRGISPFSKFIVRDMKVSVDSNLFANL